MRDWFGIAVVAAIVLGVAQQVHDAGRRAAMWDLSHMSPHDALLELREYRAAYDDN